ncbi:MAG: homocysteine S-methyltransferase [Gammaproteobacteria bacterium]|jgi:homocysteine S-methyltransferase
MYKHGFELPQFAMFPLLENPKAVATLTKIYRDYLDVIAKHGMCALIGVLDYRASPDWADLLGYSKQGLAEANCQAIDFLRGVIAEYQEDIPEILIQGLIGPRGDAYERNETITENEAEDYHSVQLQTLKEANVDLALAMTFNNVRESIGLARAASKIGVPHAISLVLNNQFKLETGETLAEAIIVIDQATDQSPEFYSINYCHPIEYKPAIASDDWIYRLRGVRPNASKMDKIAPCQIGHLEDGDPVELGQLCGDLSQRFPHMDIWGGCCGTW